MEAWSRSGGLPHSVWCCLRRLLLACLLAGAASCALAAKTYSDNGDGTLTDPSSGLHWMRCAIGQTWDGAACSGTEGVFSWTQANALTGTVTFAGQSDWRLPNIRELLMEPTLSPNQHAYEVPLAQDITYWSASTDVSASSSAYYVSYSHGAAKRRDKGNAGRVRLVRAGYAFPVVNPARPTADFVDHGDGTVTHTPSGLMWQRCAKGQSWTGGATCGGSASGFSWNAAQALTDNFAGQTDWRLPSAEELVSLVDYTIYSPALNAALFPNTSASDFWSASVYSIYVYSGIFNSGAWVVNFGSGDLSGAAGSPSLSDSVVAQVRLVRAGHLLDSFPLTVSASSLVFTAQDLGTTSSAQTVTLGNTGSAALSLNSVLASGDFATTSGCAATLAAGASCSISVTFTPTAAGPRSASLVIASDAPGSPHTISLSGSGTTSQTIVFGAAPSVVLGGSATVSATSSSGLSVTFSSLTLGTCTMTGSTVSSVAAGLCTVAANQAGNASYSAAAQVTQNNTVRAPSSRLVNLSSRGQIQTGDNRMIGGFIIQGSTPKKVLIRAAGPNLVNYGVSGVLLDPALALYAGQNVIASNDDWGSAANAAEIAASGLAPSHAKEAALLLTLSPGAYTTLVSGVGGSSGLGMVEIYELDHPEIPLVNLSTRGRVQSGGSVMIGGFIIQGNSPQTVLVRAGGPALASYGVTGVLANPKLDLYARQTVIASNDDWGTASNAAAITASGLAPAHALESAILITLQPGAYTAIVSGADGGSGTGMVEVFAQ